MSGFRVCVYAAAFVLVFAATGLSQVPQPWMPGKACKFNGSCPQQPVARPVSRTVEVNVPVPCPPPAPCMAVTACAPSPCYPPVSCYPQPCQPPCPTRPVNVRVDVVVRPESPKPCVPQRYCCENPPVFEPIFYHAAWMLRSIVCAPLGLGECMLGHGAIRQPCPPPIPVACVPRPIAYCPPPLTMCGPAVPQSMARPPVAQATSCPPRTAFKPLRSAPIAQ